MQSAPTSSAINCNTLEGIITHHLYRNYVMHLMHFAQIYSGNALIQATREAIDTEKENIIDNYRSPEYANAIYQMYNRLINNIYAFDTWLWSSGFAWMIAGGKATAEYQRLNSKYNRPYIIDLSVINDSTLYIVDYKTGKHNADNMTQLLIYAAYLCIDTRSSVSDIVIINLYVHGYNGNSPVSEDSSKITVQELIQWQAENEALLINGKPSDYMTRCHSNPPKARKYNAAKCQKCKYSGKCPIPLKYVIDHLDLTTDDSGDLTPEAIANNGYINNNVYGSQSSLRKNENAETIANINSGFINCPDYIHINYTAQGKGARFRRDCNAQIISTLKKHNAYDGNVEPLSYAKLRDKGVFDNQQLYDDLAKYVEIPKKKSVIKYDIRDEDVTP